MRGARAERSQPGPPRPPAARDLRPHVLRRAGRRCASAGGATSAWRSRYGRRTTRATCSTGSTPRPTSRPRSYSTRPPGPTTPRPLRRLCPADRPAGRDPHQRPGLAAGGVPSHVGGHAVREGGRRRPGHRRLPPGPRRPRRPCRLRRSTVCAVPAEASERHSLNEKRSEPVGPARGYGSRCVRRPGSLDVDRVAVDVDDPDVREGPCSQVADVPVARGVEDRAGVAASAPSKTSRRSGQRGLGLVSQRQRLLLHHR